MIFPYDYRPNEETIIYFLLLSRKERQPSIEDDTTAAPVGHRQKGQSSNC
jgi:hypothetical protein